MMIKTSGPVKNEASSGDVDIKSRQKRERTSDNDPLGRAVNGFKGDIIASWH